jgi:hypothetical protein
MFAIDVREWGLDNLIERFRAERQPKLEAPSKNPSCLLTATEQRKAS